MKTLLLLITCLLGLSARAASPSFQDFNTNQFGVGGNKVAIKSGALLTNISGSGLQASSVNSNSFDAPTLALFGAGGVTPGPFNANQFFSFGSATNIKSGYITTNAQIYSGNFLSVDVANKQLDNSGNVFLDWSGSVTPGVAIGPGVDFTVPSGTIRASAASGALVGTNDNRPLNFSNPVNSFTGNGGGLTNWGGGNATGTTNYFAGDVTVAGTLNGTGAANITGLMTALGTFTVSDNGVSTTIKSNKIDTGTAKFSGAVTNSGTIFLPDGSTASPSFTWLSDFDATPSGFYRVSANTYEFRVNGTATMQWSAGAPLLSSLLYYDLAASTVVTVESSRVLQYGFDSATPLSYNFKGADGSGTDINGAPITHSGGRGTGAGVGGDFIIQSAGPRASGSTLGVYTNQVWVKGSNGRLVVTNGIEMATASPLVVNSGTNQRAGNAALVGGTVTVNNTTVTANTVVMLTRKTSGGTIGTAITYTLSAGTSFTISSDNILDTSTFSYFLIEVP